MTFASLKSMLNNLTLIAVLVTAGLKANAQLDSLFFNLYTDSLKRGTYNYINVDGHYRNGTYLPLGEKELRFSASAGEFEGNSLFIDSSVKAEKITVRIELRSDPKIFREKVIYIKKAADAAILPTMDEVLGKTSTDTTPRTRKKKSRK